MPGRDKETDPSTSSGALVPLEIVDGEPVEDEESAGKPSTAPGAPVPDGYTPDGTPTLDYVRQRIATSLGAAELPARADPSGSAQARQEALRAAAHAKLAGLRAELDVHGEK